GIAAGVVTLGLASIFFGRSVSERTELTLGTKRLSQSFAFWRSAALVTAGCAALIVFALIPSRVAAVRDSLPGEVMASLSQDRLNEKDLSTLTRGYYEELDVARNDAQVQIALRPGPQWPITQLQASTKDFMLFDIIPDKSLTVNGRPVSFNHWGMRGRPCQ